MRGHTILGRSAVVGPGEAPPGEWGDCDRIVVDALNSSTAARLHTAWLQREPLVIELHPGIGLDDPLRPPPQAVTGLQPWEWNVGLDLVADRLHHSVWCNSVDSRRGRTPRWRWAELSRSLGGSVPPPGVAADVVLPDGTPALCDGGPLDGSLGARCGQPVVSWVGLEHRSLTPFGAGADGPPADPELAPDQLRAVWEPRAGARIVAPAGSGKTRVLTERARLLLGEWALPAPAMALVAYNVRAAGEMRNRLGDLPALRVRTLNALGLRLCGRSATLEPPAVRRLLDGLVDLPRRAEADPAAPWLEALSRVRLGLSDPDEVERAIPDVSGLEEVAQSFRAALLQTDSADFDEQIVAAIARLLADPDFRHRSRRFARVLLVDEFQDLTPAHLLLIRILSGPGGAVFGVGDDDQTIYGYAGASPRWLVEFDTWFPGSAEHPLEINYRCPPAIVTAAANLLSRNALRVPKTIRAAGAAAEGRDGPAASAVETLVSDRPAAATAARVGRLLSEGVAPGDIAVLCRVNASLVPVQVLLTEAGVAVATSGDTRFTARSGVRAALAWLEVASAPGTPPANALREAARRPRRGFSAPLLDLIGRQRAGRPLDGLGGWLERQGRQRDGEKVREFAADVARVRALGARGTTAEILHIVRHEIAGAGLESSANALDRWSHGAIAAHLDDLDALAELAEAEEDPARFATWLERRLAVPSDPAGVTLASVHAVKGREWPFVFVHHASSGLMPHRLATDPEEERRVMHVAITRAVRRCVVVCGSSPSPFVEEMASPGRPDPATPNQRRPVEPGGPGPARRGSGARAPRGPAPAASGVPVDLLPAEVGTGYQLGGHDYRVVEVSREAAVAQVGDGPARARTSFGAVVRGRGGPALLAHPAGLTALERLKEWRGAKAKAMGKPAFVIFDDATLRLLAAALPTDEPGLLAIRGIGPLKLESYGEELIALFEELRGP